MRKARRRKLDSYRIWTSLSVYYKHMNMSKGHSGRRTLKNFRDCHQKSARLKEKRGSSCCNRRDRPTSQSENGEYLFSSSLVSLSSPASPGADYDTGPPGSGKKTQCALLCQKFGFQHISLDDVLREKSDDQTYLHAKFLKDCLEEKVDVPRELTVSLLEEKINQGGEDGRKWSLVHGFPESIQDLLEFEGKVQKTNYTVLLNCTAEGMLKRVGRSEGEIGEDLDATKRIQDFHVRNAEVKNHLMATKDCFKEVSRW